MRTARILIAILLTLTLSTLAQRQPRVSASSPNAIFLPLVVGAPPSGGIYVALSGSDANTGASDKPLRTIAYAVKRAKPGDTISVSPGNYPEGLTLSADGTESSPITLKAEAGATINPPKGTPLHVTGSYWIVSGFTIDVGGRDNSAVWLEAPANHITLRDGKLLNGTSHAVLLGDGTSNNAILHNEIAHFWHPNDVDAHGVAIRESHNNLIADNDIHDNSGDAIQVFCSDAPALNGQGAIGNKIINNKLYNNRENAVDIKSSDGTVVSGNEMWGYKPSATSYGAALEIHYGAKNVTVDHNTIRDSTWGIEVTRGTKGSTEYPVAPSNITIHHNYIHSITLGGIDNRGDGAGIVLREATNVRLWNNTVQGTAGPCLVLTWANAQPNGVEVLNNALSGCGNSELWARDVTFPNMHSDYNGYDRADGARLQIGSRSYTLAAWRAAMAYDMHSVESAGAVAMEGSLVAGAALIDSGTDVGLPFCGAAPDIGAYETGCGP